MIKYQIFYDELGNITHYIQQGHKMRVKVNDTNFVESNTKPALDDAVDPKTKKLIKRDKPAAKRPPREPSWTQKRAANYGSLSEQLELLYDDIQAGVFGEEAKKGKWAQHIARVKARIPKDTK